MWSEKKLFNTDRMEKVGDCFHVFCATTLPISPKYIPFAKQCTSH